MYNRHAPQTERYTERSLKPTAPSSGSPAMAMAHSVCTPFRQDTYIYTYTRQHRDNTYEQKEKHFGAMAASSAYHQYHHWKRGRKSSTTHSLENKVKFETCGWFPPQTVGSKKSKKSKSIHLCIEEHTQPILHQNHLIWMFSQLSSSLVPQRQNQNTPQKKSQQLLSSPLCDFLSGSLGAAGVGAEVTGLPLRPDLGRGRSGSGRCGGSLVCASFSRFRCWFGRD